MMRRPRLIGPFLAPGTPSLTLSLGISLLVACGPKPEGRTLPDESDDLVVGGGSLGPTLEGTDPVSPSIDGTQWRWVEAHCTEGPLDLESRGFTQQLRISLDPKGLLLVYDQAFATEACTETIAQRFKPGEGPEDEWQMSEEAHVSLPPDCGIAPEKERPGNLRIRDGKLEVYIQRSRWCNGLEVRMVYESTEPTVLEPDQLARHYAAHFSRQDLERLTGLFAETGSLVEPFTESATGVTRHDGIASVRAWYAEAFANVPWLALRLTKLEAGEEEGQVVTSWQYMDPRVAAPFSGRNFFTVAGGEIFETRVELIEEPSEGPAAGDASGDETGDGEGEAGGESAEPEGPKGDDGGARPQAAGEQE